MFVPMAPIRPQLLVSHANHSATQTSICMYVYMYVSMYVSMYVCIYVCIYLSIYVCIYLYMYVCIYVCMYVCMYVCLYISAVCGDGECSKTHFDGNNFIESGGECVAPNVCANCIFGFYPHPGGFCDSKYLRLWFLPSSWGLLRQ